MSHQLSPDTILMTALEISSVEDRSAYLDESCADDRALREEMASLIDAHFTAETFLEPLANSLWREAASEKVGDMIGRYKLLQQIGEGGFGTVFLAEQSAPMKRQVALKVIKPGMDSKEIIARFEAERQVLALMDHPHIAKVHDAGTTDGGRPYFVMELVNGVPITKHCAEMSHDVKERLELFIEVCAALQHAHQKGIIHRDLKPSNILVSTDQEKPLVKVIDFGIAKAMGVSLTEKTIFTQFGRMMGTPQYMSPEQAGHNTINVDTRSDIYALGVILYEVLTGSTPLGAKQLQHADYGEMQRLIREVTPPKPSTKLAETQALSSAAGHPSAGLSPRALRGDLDWIVLKALEKDPTRRYESAGAMAEDLLRFLQHKPIEARPPSIVYAMMRFTRRHRSAVFAGTTLLLALLLGTVGTSIGMKRALHAKGEVERKNVELDQQKLELVDTKERLAGLLKSNQKMLVEIGKTRASAAKLPIDFEALQQENQTLLDQVKNEVANQERYAEEIEKLKQTQVELNTAKAQAETKLTGLQRSITMLSLRAAGKNDESNNLSSELPLDRKTGEVKAPHTIVWLTAVQIDEVQTLGTLTLTNEQWRELREKSPQSPKRLTNIVPLPWPERGFRAGEDYAIELARDRMAVIHQSDATASVATVRDQLFCDGITSLRMNERGEFHLDGKLVPFAILLKSLATAPDGAQLNDQGKLLFTAKADDPKTYVPRWLNVKLPAGAQPTDAVFQSRLRELAAAADRIGLPHGMFTEKEK